MNTGLRNLMKVRVIAGERLYKAVTCTHAVRLRSGAAASRNRSDPENHIIIMSLPTICTYIGTPFWALPEGTASTGWLDNILNSGVSAQPRKGETLWPLMMISSLRGSKSAVIEGIAVVGQIRGIVRRHTARETDPCPAICNARRKAAGFSC